MKKTRVIYFCDFKKLKTYLFFNSISHQMIPLNVTYWALQVTCLYGNIL